MRCPICGNTERFRDDICLNCGQNMNPKKPRKDLGKVDSSKLANGLAKRRKDDKPEELRKGSKLETCPRCGLQTLWYNKQAKKFECLNPYCPKRHPPTMSEYLTDYFLHSHEE